jgi:hypothetical protein
VVGVRRSGVSVSPAVRASGVIGRPRRGIG